MPDGIPAQSPTPPTTQPPPADREQPLLDRYQNFATLRRTIRDQVARQAVRFATPLVTEENLPLLLETAAQTVSQRSIKFLPKKAALTRADISAALATAFDELARKQDWLDHTLSRKKREALASAVAESIETELSQESLQQALTEQEAYKTYAQETLGDRDEVIQAVQADLRQANVDSDTGKKVAAEVAENLDRKALHLGASPTPAVAATVGIALERHAPDLSVEEHSAASRAVLQGSGGKKLQARYEAVSVLSDDIYAIFTKHKKFSKIVRDEIEKDVVLSIADETQDRKPTVVHLKEPLLLGKNKDIEIRKLELYNRTREADPKLPQNAAMPLFRYGMRLERPKTANLDSVETFTIFDPETNKRVAVTKDRLDLRALQKIDRKAQEKFGFLFDEKNLRGFEKTYRWLKNPTGEALRGISRPLTTRVRRVVGTLTKPLRDLLRSATSPISGAVQTATTAVRTAVGKVTTPVRQAVGKAVSVVTSPVKKAAQKLAMKGVQLAAQALIKLGLGGVVKKIEQLALAGSVVGIPVLIAQELVTRGLGKLGKTAKKLFRDWKQVFQEGLQDPIRGAVRFVGTGVDTLGAGLGAVAGGTLGVAGGALLGAFIGSVVPVVGTILGGIVGGLAGGIFGAGYGAKAGYELRRKIQRKIALFLALKALGLNPFKIAWALLKAGGIYLLGKIVPFIKTVLSRAAIGFKGLFGIARYGPQLLAKQLAAGEGLFAQVFRGIGNIFSQIPSGIARAFNSLTGWISGKTINAATTIDTVTTEVLTAGPGEGLPLMSTLGVIGMITLFAFITYNVFITAFHVTPTEVVPYFKLAERYINISKTACATSSSGEVICDDNGQLKLKNPTESGQGPYSIVYQIRIEATEQTLTNVTITDEYTAYGENDPTPPSPLVWNGSLLIAPRIPWTQTVNLTIPRSSLWDDALLINTVEVTANIAGEADPVSLTDSLVITLGNPPASSCPIPGGRVHYPSYNGTNETGHGSNTYWGSYGCNYDIPWSSGCWSPSDAADPDGNNKCRGTPNACDEYGYAADFVGSGAGDPVQFPSIFGNTITWTIQGASFPNNDGDWGWGARYTGTDGTNSYFMYITHLNPSGFPSSGVSGDLIGTTSPNLTNPHVHVELSINGSWVRPDFLCGGVGP